MSDFFNEENKTVCKKCGAENDKGAKFCMNCGEKFEEVKPVEAEEVSSTPWQENNLNINYGPDSNTYNNQPSYYTPEQPKTTSNMIGLSIASLVCGILSLITCCMGIPLGIGAIVTGIISLSKKYSGKGMAIAGIVTGALGILFWIFIFVIAGIDSFYNMY